MSETLSLQAGHRRIQDCNLHSKHDTQQGGIAIDGMPKEDALRLGEGPSALQVCIL